MATDEKSPEKTEQPVPKKTAKKQPVVEKMVPVKQRKRWSTDSLFWGLLLVTIGVLMLVSNFGLVDVRWGELWRLWPLLVIAGGLSILSSTHLLWRILSVVFILLIIGLIALVGTGTVQTDRGKVSEQTTSVDRQAEASSAMIDIDAGATKLTVSSEDMNEIVEAKLWSDTLELEKKSEFNNGVQRVNVSTHTPNNWWVAPRQNDLDIKLTEQLPLSLVVDAGASSINLDLSRVNLTVLKLNAGASSSDVTLGAVAKNTSVDIDSGASSLTLRIPQDSGVLLRFDGGLSSKNFADLREVSENEYRSNNYETAEHRIEIKLDAGLAKVDIFRY